MGKEFLDKLTERWRRDEDDRVRSARNCLFLRDQASRRAEATCSCWMAVMRVKKGSARVRGPMDSVIGRLGEAWSMRLRQAGCWWMGAK